MSNGKKVIHVDVRERKKILHISHRQKKGNAYMGVREREAIHAKAKHILSNTRKEEGTEDNTRKKKGR